MVYLDDVIIYFKNIIKYVKHLNWIFSQLKWIELKIKIKKCKFTKSEIKLLGHWISAKGTILDLDKVTVIKVLEWSITILELREFLKTVLYY